MSQRGNSIKLKNGLTPKQNKFTKLIIEDLAAGKQPNATEAAMQVYDTKDKSVAAGIAGDNLQKPIIQDVIKKALEDEGWNIAENLKQIRQLAKLQPEKPTISGILQANLAILKLTGAIEDHKNSKSMPKSGNININITYNEAKERISALNGVSTDFIADAEAS